MDATYQEQHQYALAAEQRRIRAHVKALNARAVAEARVHTVRKSLFTLQGQRSTNVSLPWVSIQHGKQS